MTKMILKPALLWIAAACIAAWMVWQGHEMWLDTHDPGRPLNPLSAVRVSDADLSSVSACARDVVQARLHNRLEPKRSELFYTEWRCDIAARRRTN